MSEFQVLTTPTKSEGDKKEYRLIELSNGFKALLVRKVEENSESEPLAAVALKVDIGSYDEPQAIGGLAHFLEHNLDLGSEKYPDESSFNQFVSQNGGWNNANTENVCTTYFFEVSEKAIPEALDRFAQQFVSPIFSKNMLQREREAVDSEYQMAKCQDFIRIESFYKVFMKEDHPASWFSNGNLRTLKDETTDDELYDAVRELFKKYIPNIMHFSMQSSRSLDEMQQLVIDNFSGLKEGEIIPRKQFSLEETFKPEFYTKMYFLKPMESTRDLYLTWFVESLDKYYMCRPLHYLARIFNNEGEGGFSSYLKTQRLAVSSNLDSSCQLFIDNSMFTLIKLSIKLTDHGVENIDHVLETIFSYVLMIQETPIDEHRRLYNELKEKSEIEFRFQTVLPASCIVLCNTAGMHYFDDENILRGHSVFQEFDEKVITDVIHTINERKFNLLIVNDKHPTFDKKEKCFETEYEEKDFPEEYQKLWDERKLNPEFFLEKPNPFKCTNYEIFVSEEESPKYPTRIQDNEKFEVWYKLDSKYKKPQGYISINFLSPFNMKSAYNCLAMLLFEKLLTFNLTKEIASAAKAGFVVCANIRDGNFCLEFSGYSEKLLLVVETAMKTLKQTQDTLDDKLFEMLKKDTIKTLKNVILFPHCLQESITSKLMKTNFWAEWEYDREIDKITMNDSLKLAEKFYRDAKIQVLLQGNVEKSSSYEIVNLLKEYFTNEPSMNYKPDTRGYQLPLGTNVLRIESLIPNDDNSIIKNFYQVGPYSVRCVSLLQLLQSIISPKAFDYLRTKEQLGYDVGVYTEEFANIWGFSVYVASQESKNNFERVLEKIETFTTEVAPKVLEELSDEDFSTFVEARVKMLTTEHLDVDDEKEKNWDEILKQEYFFNRSQVVAAETGALSKTDVQDFFKSFTAPEKMRRLSIQVIGNKKNEDTLKEVAVETKLEVEFLHEKLHENENLIANLEDFQSKMFLYPLV